MNLVKFHQPSLRHSAMIWDKAFDELFNKSLSGFGLDNTLTAPAVNILEHENQFELQFAAPGYAKESFKVEVEKDLLTVSVEQSEVKTPGEGVRIRRREFAYGNFSRSFRLGEHIDGQSIGARYENGVLTVTLPKKVNDPALSTRRIEIA